MKKINNSDEILFLTWNEYIGENNEDYFHITTNEHHISTLKRCSTAVKNMIFKYFEEREFAKYFIHNIVI